MTNTTTALGDILNLLKTIQGLDNEFPLQYAVCLIEIAKDEGLSVSSLAERTNLSLSTVSRIVGALSDHRQRGEPFELVEVQICAKERRRKELYLSDRGRQFIKTLCNQSLAA